MHTQNFCLNEKLNRNLILFEIHKLAISNGNYRLIN